MAGPEAIQEWLNQQGGLSAVSGPYRPGWDGFDSAAVTAAPALIPVAFLGRTSTDDQQDPVGSLLRQLRISQEALPEGCVIVAYFYDVESGRKDLDVRGRGDRHERLAIPIPRDGGIHDLLKEAASPNRRFQAVICEQIDRIARRTYYGTLVEHQLQSANVGLWAADEPIRLDTDMLIDPTTVLTRRVKQGIAEWYALDMIKRARDGFETHTDQGYNVGKACYGYRTVQVRLDKQDSDGEYASDKGGAGQAGRVRSGNRGKGRNGPRTKSKLVKEPVEAAVVRRIYDWRITERLSYEAIADRLNLDLATNPPPTPPDPERAVGRWTWSSVRDVLNQPKYTGYMVWNRRAMKTRNGSPNPMEKWVWSNEPTHEKIIDLADFIAAQQVVRRRERSRTQAGANTHPQTKRTYRLRSYLFCEICGRRMFGKTRRQHAYYACAPKKGYVPGGHPDSLWVREVALLDGLNEFLSHHVFGPYRQELLSSALRDLDMQAEQTRTERIGAIKKSIADLDARKKRLIRTLEVTGDDDEEPDQELIQDIKNRRAEIKAERARLAAELETLEEQVNDQQNPNLLRLLPVGVCDLDALPEDLARKLFEALRLEIHYNKTDNTAVCRITLSGETLPALQQTTQETGVVLPFKKPTGKNAGITKVDANEKDETLSDSSPLFPSVVCPRQVSNLRHVTDRASSQGSMAMSTDLLVRMGHEVGGDACPLDVDLFAAEVGCDPLAREALVDLVALGVAVSAWRAGPVEGWHVGGRIGQVEMMRANAATTRRVRGLLSELLPERWWTWDVRTGLRTGALMLWTLVAGEIGSVDRRLPGGRTVADLAMDDEQVAEYRSHVAWHRDRWLALTAECGLRVALVMLACQGAWLCRRWWLHPDWPRQVEEFVTYVNEPSRHPVPEAAAAIQELQQYGRLTDPDEVRRGLLAGPDLLDARIAADSYWLGLVSIAPGAVSIRFGVHPDFLNLLRRPTQVQWSESNRDAAWDESL